MPWPRFQLIPQLLACINRRSPVGAAVKQNKKFTVNLLSEQQSDVADCFAGRVTANGGSAFDFGQANWANDAADLPPRLEGACASFHCHVEQMHDAGTHVILIGRVISAVSGSEPPLAYVHQDYARVMKSQAGHPSAPNYRAELNLGIEDRQNSGDTRQSPRWR